MAFEGLSDLSLGLGLGLDSGGTSNNTLFGVDGCAAPSGWDARNSPRYYPSAEPRRKAAAGPQPQTGKRRRAVQYPHMGPVQMSHSPPSPRGVSRRLHQKLGRAEDVTTAVSERTSSGV